MRTAFLSSNLTLENVMCFPKFFVAWSEHNFKSVTDWGDLMAEIKSTLEIALEKAKAMEISSDDRKRFKREEVLSRARDIFQSYTNRAIRSGSLADAITATGKDASLLKQCLIEIVVGTLDPSHSSDRIWEGLRELGLGDAAPFQRAFTRIAEDDRRARKEGAERVEKMLRESLAKSGIAGTAVDPNVEASPQCKEVLDTLDQTISAELHRLRQEIARAIEKDSSSPR